MVKVEIVEEKEENNSPYHSGASSASASTDSLSSVSSELSADETFMDRVSALVDIVPPATRHSIATKISRTGSFLKSTAKFAGNVVWVISTSAMFVVLPLALVWEDEARLVAQDQEMLEQQQGAQQMLSPTGQMYPSPTNEGPKPVIPPGF